MAVEFHISQSGSRMMSLTFVIAGVDKEISDEFCRFCNHGMRKKTKDKDKV